VIALLGRTLLAFAAQDPIVDLHEALGRSDAPARRSAADKLALEPGITLERWISAIQDLRPFREGSPKPPGPHSVHVAFQVLDSTEETDLQVYVPRSLGDREGPNPLLLAFHGTGGTGAEVEPMWRALAENLAMIVVAPSEAGKNEGYAFSPRERAAALEALRWAKGNFDVEENRIFATGISRGGHLAWDLALRHPDLFAAIAPMIGGPRFQLDHGQNNLRFLENVATLPIRDLQGAKDDPGLVANVRLAFARLDKLKAADAKLLEFPELRHEFDFGAVDWKDFFGSARRNPIPDRVVLLAARPDDARAFWVQITKLSNDVTEDVAPKVVASTWNALDENGRRKLLEQEVEKHTARLEVKRTGVGKFAATGERVAGFRILLSASMFDPAKPVQVLFGGKLVEKKVKPDPRVLLEDFVERFDRSFLPIAAIDVP
jgi:dienelactone hydrolase